MLLSRAFCVHSNKKENLSQLKIEVLEIEKLRSKLLILCDEVAGFIAFSAITGKIPSPAIRKLIFPFRNSRVYGNGGATTQRSKYRSKC